MQKQTKGPHTNAGTASQENAFSADAWLPAIQSDDLIAWVKANQTVAMIGAFAIGVFVGAMMRD